MKSIRILLMILVALSAMNLVVNIGRNEKPAYAVNANGPDYKLVDVSSEQSMKLAQNANIPTLCYDQYIEFLINNNVNKGYRFVDTIKYNNYTYLVFQR